MRTRWLPFAVLMGALSACDWVYLPVNPVVKFSAYQLPYYRQDEFAKRFQSWRAGRSATWTLSYRATAHSDSAVIIPSSGPATFGSQMTGSGGRGGSFTPSRAELVGLFERLLETRLFDLYDGHYGAYDQGGGLLGPEIKVEMGGLVKQVSYDFDLSPNVSWEARALKDSSDAIAAVAIKYIRAAVRPSAAPQPSGPSGAPGPSPSATAVPTPSVTVRP